jgi:hypothetical protein
MTYRTPDMNAAQVYERECNAATEKPQGKEIPSEVAPIPWLEIRLTTPFSGCISALQRLVLLQKQTGCDNHQPRREECDRPDNPPKIHTLFCQRGSGSKTHTYAAGIEREDVRANRVCY